MLSPRTSNPHEPCTRHYLKHCGAKRMEPRIRQGRARADSAAWLTSFHTATGHVSARSPRITGHELCQTERYGAPVSIPPGGVFSCVCVERRKIKVAEVLRKRILFLKFLWHISITFIWASCSSLLPHSANIDAIQFIIVYRKQCYFICQTQIKLKVSVKFRSKMLFLPLGELWS